MCIRNTGLVVSRYWLAFAQLTLTACPHMVYVNGEIGIGLLPDILAACLIYFFVQ